MIFHFAILLGFQLIGEVASRLLLPVAPGPVIGMALLFAALFASRKLAEAMRPTVDGFLGHLSLFFVPAGVGVVTQLSLIREEALAIGAALVLSTAAAILVGALTFAALTKGASDE
ncbi:MAG: CidA/LrgA family protein [Pseudomonadota bacterium]